VLQRDLSELRNRGLIAFTILTQTGRPRRIVNHDESSAPKGSGSKPAPDCGEARNRVRNHATQAGSTDGCQMKALSLLGHSDLRQSDNFRVVRQNEAAGAASAAPAASF
jgi:hypothetical protein